MAFEGDRNIGVRHPHLNVNKTKWTTDMLKISPSESIDWLQDQSNDVLTSAELESWLVVGKRTKTIKDETIFCSDIVLRNVLAPKNLLRSCDQRKRDNAIKRCNAYEAVGKSVFQNRSAVKFANINASLDFMFTDPVDPEGVPLVKDDDQLVFADVCAGPGGFSEYVLQREKWQAKGIGFTLKVENDFDLDTFVGGRPNNFDAFYGSKNDGNIYDPDNIESLTKYVQDNSGDGVGCHFMMSDGGFDVSGKRRETLEILSKQLYLCQCLVALSIVRPNGHFVTKLFDTFTPFSVGLIYLMYKCFIRITIFKPKASRPNSSERYLVCKWKKKNTEQIRKHLFKVNVKMQELKTANPIRQKDILELVPLENMRKDKKFFELICEINNTIAETEILAILNIKEFYDNPERNQDTLQNELKFECWSKWKIPIKSGKSGKKLCSINDCNSLLCLGEHWQIINCDSLLSSKEHRLLLKAGLWKKFVIDDWSFVPLQNTDRSFFVSLDCGDNHKYDKKHKMWTKLEKNIIGIPSTLIYGELVEEFDDNDNTYCALHIIDGIVLGGIDIVELSLQERHQMCRKFATALMSTIDRPQGAIQVRCKPLIPMNKLKFHLINELSDGKLPMSHSKHNYEPCAILLFKEFESDLKLERFMETFLQRQLFIIKDLKKALEFIETYI